MRLRKNKKLTASMIWSTAASPSSPNPPEELMQSHVCVLNRSPWDAPLSPSRDYPLYAAQDSLPSPQHHHNNNQLVMEEDDSCPPLADDDSLRSMDSMKISSDPENKSGSSMSILPTPPSPCVRNSKDKDKDKGGSAMGPPKRRGRPRKLKVVAPSTSTANPNEFYYYSGFGPRWGKRRGADHLNQSDIQGMSINAAAAADIISNKGGGHKIRKSNRAKIQHTSSDQLDYIDDEYEDDDEVDGSRKRTRKLVKARSLKSLM